MKITIRESVTRDGWQNYKTFIPTDKKIELAKEIIDAGARKMDLISFVRTDFVPQFVEAEEVVKGVLPYAKEQGCEIYGGGSNKKGAERALSCGIKNVIMGVSVSDEHSVRNARRSVEQAFAELKTLVSDLQGSDVNIHVGLPCVFGSPFGDEVSIDRVIYMIDELVQMGVNDIGLPDSAGISTPDHTRAVLKQLLSRFPADIFGCHFHNTRGMGLANAYVAYEEGIREFDTALGGMGGCPFIENAKGNIATEDLVNMFQMMGVDTGYDVETLVSLSLKMGQEIGTEIISYMANLQCCSNR
ncbi:MAG: hydroxymethylglutaryl-CoA lyase [Parasporobacterium sp.]|nr:hydroxymethylglutaryl-CoA lyase [Parasporobacterium sp.]